MLQKLEKYGCGFSVCVLNYFLHELSDTLHYLLNIFMHCTISKMPISSLDLSFFQIPQF